MAKIKIFWPLNIVLDICVQIIKMIFEIFLLALFWL